MLIASLPDLISPGHPDHGRARCVSIPRPIRIRRPDSHAERLRLEAVQHVYHAVGLLAGNPDHVDLVQNLHEFRNVLYTTLDFDVNVRRITGASCIVRDRPPQATKEDVECTVQALWCLGTNTATRMEGVVLRNARPGRLIVPLSIEQIEAEKVVVRVQTLLGTLLAMLAPSDTNSEIWSAFGTHARLVVPAVTSSNVRQPLLCDCCPSWQPITGRSIRRWRAGRSRC